MSHHFCLRSHAVPERLDPLAAQNAEDHHEGMEEVGEVPPGGEIKRKSVIKLSLCLSLKAREGRGNPSLSDPERREQVHVTERRAPPKRKIRGFFSQPSSYVIQNKLSHWPLAPKSEIHWSISQNLSVM